MSAACCATLNKLFPCVEKQEHRDRTTGASNLAVHSLDRAGGSSRSLVGDKAEATRAAAVLILHHSGLKHNDPSTQIHASRY